MTRKEIYEAIKKYDLGGYIKNRFGRNCTNVSNKDLEGVINLYIKDYESGNIYAGKVAKEKRENPTNIVKAFVKLVSTLVAYEVINDEDAESILENMR